MATQGLSARENVEEVQVGKKRKPYTITKSRETWSDEEHRKFLDALKLFDRDWRRIETFIGTKNVIQIRSHAQKHFLKIQRNNTGEHIPPPRPKKRPPIKSKDDPDYSDEPGAVSPNPAGTVSPFMGTPSGYAQWLSDSNAVGGYSSEGGLLPWAEVEEAAVSATSAASSVPFEAIAHHHFSSQVHYVPAARCSCEVTTAMPAAQAQAQASHGVYAAQQEVLRQFYTKQEQHLNSRRQLQQTYEVEPLIHMGLESSSPRTVPASDYSRVVAFVTSLFSTCPRAHVETFENLTTADREVVLELTGDLAASLSVQMDECDSSTLLQHCRTLIDRCVLACQQQMEAAHDFADTVVTPPPPSEADTLLLATPPLQAQLTSLNYATAATVAPDRMRTPPSTHLSLATTSATALQSPPALYVPTAAASSAPLSQLATPSTAAATAALSSPSRRVLTPSLVALASTAPSVRHGTNSTSTSSSAHTKLTPHATDAAAAPTTAAASAAAAFSEFPAMPSPPPVDVDTPSDAAPSSSSPPPPAMLTPPLSLAAKLGNGGGDGNKGGQGNSTTPSPPPSAVSTPATAASADYVLSAPSTSADYASFASSCFLDVQLPPATSSALVWTEL